jgi:hypothetical protein
VSEAPSEVVDELYGAPLDEFVARRDARAKEIRKTDRAAADAVKKLRKPSVAAAALNRLARGAGDDVKALLAAGEALRQAQFGGGDRDAIRAAVQDEREAVERLVEQAGKLSPSTLEEVREALRAAATDDEARAGIERGNLTEARRASGLGGFGLAADAGTATAAAPRKPSAAKPAKTGRAPKADAAAEAERRRAEREAEAERKRAAKERVKAAREALRDAEKAAAAAERERDRAAKALMRLEREAAEARKEVERRRAELEAAEDVGTSAS